MNLSLVPCNVAACIPVLEESHGQLAMKFIFLVFYLHDLAHSHNKSASHLHMNDQMSYTMAWKSHWVTHGTTKLSAKFHHFEIAMLGHV